MAPQNGPHQFTETTRVGYGQRIVNSIKGIVTGIALFFGSFVLLFWNEGRLDVSTVAQNAVEANPTEVQSELDGQFVYVEGTLSTTETLGDDIGYLNPGDYIALSRNVEMYAWVEEAQTDSETNLGGSETQTTTYNYKKQWTSMPQNSSNFKIQEGHFNPEMSYENWSGTVSSATVGPYNVDPTKLSLPGQNTLPLTEDMVVLIAEYEELQGNYIYLPYGFDGTFTAPEVGDVRISYTALKNNVEGTVFAELKGADLETFVDTENDNTKIYRFLEGGREEAIATMHDEHTTMTWILRVVGFFMMYIGLSALFGPISVLLDVVPFLGSVSRGLISIVTFVVSLILTIVTIIVSMIFHNIWALIIVALLTIGGIAYFMKNRAQKKGLTGGPEKAPAKEEKKAEPKKEDKS